MQHARTADGRTVAGTVLDAVATRNADARASGSFGAVVGATIGESGENLDVNGPLLVPGIGAQGGTVDDVRRIFGAAAPQRPAQQLARDARRRSRQAGAARGRAPRRGGLPAPRG